MYGSRDGHIDEAALSSILKTALGVAELSVTNLFQAIDQEGTGQITFGEWPRGQGEEGPVVQGCAWGWGTGTQWERRPRVLTRAMLSCATGNSQEEGSSPGLAGAG